MTDLTSFTGSTDLTSLTDLTSSTGYTKYRTLLKEGRYISIASISNIEDTLQPLSTVVFFHATSKGIFWTSARMSQHSKNLASFPSAFISMYEENLKEGTV